MVMCGNQALVPCRLDCNVMQLSWLLKTLQLVQDAAARVLTGTCRDHMSPVLAPRAVGTAEYVQNLPLQIAELQDI